ncbi:MAG: zincin-like metallopeptidase domain-containing protein [Pseudomonadota bacterium]
MSRPVLETRPDLYARVTDQILSDLQRGVRPWTRPWSAEHLAGHVSRPLRHNLQPYNGVNVLLLWAQACAKGYAAPIWMTFRQALELGAHVRKGEQAATVVYANALTRTEAGEDEEHRIPFLKAYSVFNVDQIEGLPEPFHAVVGPRLDGERRIAQAEAFFAGLKADIQHGGSQAYYAMGPDHVRMPPFEAFCDPQAYYATLAHECVHWTRHPSRLDRDLGRKRWGDEGYAREELVAELGAAFVCADLGLEMTPREDHAAYLASWLQVLKADKRAIFSAASHAQKAADYLTALQAAPD